MTDFAALDVAAASDTPCEIEIKHPQSGEGLGVFVSVIGAESEKFQAYLRTEANAARRKAFEQSRKGNADKPSTVEEDEASIVRAVSACVVSWRTVIEGKSEPVIVWEGKKLDCTPANVALWLNRFRWVRGQINEATADLGNFIKD